MVASGYPAAVAVSVAVVGPETRLASTVTSKGVPATAIAGTVSHVGVVCVASSTADRDTLGVVASLDDTVSVVVKGPAPSSRETSSCAVEKAMSDGGGPGFSVKRTAFR